VEYSRQYFKLNIALLAFSMCMGLYYYILSIGYFSEHHQKIIDTLSLVCIALLSPDLSNYIITKFVNKNSSRRFSSTSLYSIMSILILILIGTVISFYNLKINHLLLYLAIPIIVTYLLIYLFQYSIWKDIKYILLFSLFSVYIGSAMWKYGWQGPLYLEQLSSTQLNEIDVNFHASIIGIIKTYFVPSTGLNGTPYLPYHWGIHWIFAQYSNILNLNGFWFANLGYPLIIIPLYLKSILLLIVSIRNYKGFNNNLSISTIFILFFIIILFTSNISTVPIDNYSYVGSLMLSFYIFAFFLDYLRYRKYILLKLKLYDIIIFIILIPLSIGIIALIKISTSFIILGLFTYLVIRLNFNLPNLVIYSFLLSILVYGLVLTFSTDITSTHSSGFSIFNFVKNIFKYFSIDFIPHYISIVIFLFLYLTRNSISNLAQIKNMFLTKNHIIELEILPVIMIISLFPGLLFDLRGSGLDFNFYNYVFWISIIITLGYVPYLFYENHFIKLFYSNKLLIYIKYFVIIIVIFDISANFISELTTNLRYNLGIRYNMVGIKPTRISLKSSAANIINGKNILGINSNLNNLSNYDNINYELIKILESIDKNKLINKRETCIYIPKSNRVFWDMQTRQNGTPFIVPGITSLAMIEGLPDLESTSRNLRGYHLYNFDSNKKANSKYEELSNNELKLSARQRGFSKIIKISYINNEFVVERIDA
jgi:hypothetical protein